MSFNRNELTCDGFLNGRLQVLQPRHGYRAATDPVFLAAAVNAKAGQSVLELGCGVGVASLCLGWRVKGLRQIGLELQTNYALLARENAATNQVPLHVVEGDLETLPRVLVEQTFDHVIFNPPYFSGGAVTAPLSSSKHTAHVEETPLVDWVKVAFKRLKPRGQLTVIHLAERLPDLLSALPSDAGDIHILPLAARIGRPAKRVIVTALKGTAGPSRLLAPLIIHQGIEHTQDGDDFGPTARAVLREGLALPIFAG